MKLHIQLSRYAVVGLASNALGYLLYLLLTEVGMGHKTAMTLLYGIGVLQTFVFNKRWSFRHEGPTPIALRRYITAYGVGYAINYLALWILVDKLGLPHQWVQGFMIFALAGMLFLMQKYWVFSRKVRNLRSRRPCHRVGKGSSSAFPAIYCR